MGDRQADRPTADTEKNRRRRPGDPPRRFGSGLLLFLGRHGSSVVLVVVGVLCLAAAIWVVPDRQAVATALVAFGVAQVVLGAVLSRAEGPLSLTPSGGLKTVLRAVDRRASEAGLTQEERAEAARRALTMYSEAERRPLVFVPGRGWAWSPTSKTSFLYDLDSIADAAVASVVADEPTRADGQSQEPEVPES
jgi:hypothetical protein